MTPATTPQVPDGTTSPGFADGFGLRERTGEAGTAELIETLRLREGLADAPGFDFALRERVSRLANFRHAYYARALKARSDVGPAARGSRVPKTL